MRGTTLLSTMLALALAAPAVAVAQTPAQTTPPPAAHTGGAEYGVKPTRAMVPGSKAVRLKNGLAAAPADAPPRVQRAIWAANEIVGKPYRYGGGHRSFKDTGYDCSGTISYALRGAKLLKSPLDSGSFMRWGRSGKGRWITVYAHGGHAYVVIAGLRLDTSAAGERVSSGKGPRWRTTPRGGGGFTLRHPKGY